MPRKLPPEKTRWKKGQSGNPEGARKHHPALKALKNLTLDTYRDVIEAVCSGNISLLATMAKGDDPKMSALQVGVARAFYAAIQKGDYEVIERIAQRIVGKIPDELNVVSKNLNANVETKPIDRKEVRDVIAKLEKEF